MKPLAGCLLALIAAPLLVVLLVLALAGGIAGAFASLLPFGRSPGGSVAVCRTGTPVTTRTASIRNLCYGPTDAGRLARTIAAIRPDSPLIAQAQTIVDLARLFGLDPLLIVQWQGESQMATDAPPRSANGPDNGGNVTWAAAEPYAAVWGCTPGGRTDYGDEGGYLFARCPSIEAGLGLWFAYVATRYPAGAYPDLATYAETYNSCAYPGNRSSGFLCGEPYAQSILDLLARHAGAPSFDPTGYRFPIVGYTGPIDLHWGLEAGGADLFAPEGTPLVAMRGGTVSYAGYDVTGGNAVRIEGTDGSAYWYSHLRDAPLVTSGQLVSTGQPIGLVGRSGNAHQTAPHLHIGIGPTIIIGGGPTGGLGSDSFDAVALLRSVYACCP